MELTLVTTATYFDVSIEAKAKWYDTVCKQFLTPAFRESVQVYALWNYLARDVWCTPQIVSRCILKQANKPTVTFIFA